MIRPCPHRDDEACSVCVELVATKGQLRAARMELVALKAHPSLPFSPAGLMDATTQELLGEVAARAETTLEAAPETMASIGERWALGLLIGAARAVMRNHSSVLDVEVGDRPR